ncbi:MAG: phosphoribosylanthranilate isomerase [Bacteroidales bacterium]
MSNLKVKVCGITRPENMLQIASLRPDFMGFIFYPQSKRDVSKRIHELPLEAIPPSIKKVAVLVNHPLEEAEKILSTFRFDLVQLHGYESPDYCRQLRQKAAVIKSFGVGENLPPNIGEYNPYCDYFLFDTLGKQAGGNGVPFDHQLLQNYNEQKPYLLAGGISPETDLHRLSEQVQQPVDNPMLFALDINSRFETEPGIKDPALIEMFLNKVRQMNLH